MILLERVVPEGSSTELASHISWAAKYVVIIERGYTMAAMYDGCMFSKAIFMSSGILPSQVAV